MPWQVPCPPLRHWERTANRSKYSGSWQPRQLQISGRSQFPSEHGDKLGKTGFSSCARLPHYQLTNLPALETSSGADPFAR